MSKLSIMLYTLLAILLVVLFIYSVIALIFSQAAYHSPNQVRFAEGKLPDPLPNGSYKGTAGNAGDWLGKSFNSETNTGINDFREVDKTVQRYVFKTYIGKGVQDTDKDVLKIDYNLPENPFYLRFLLDEIVEVAPGHYLGKLHIRLIPFIPFVFGYFELEK